MGRPSKLYKASVLFFMFFHLFVYISVDTWIPVLFTGLYSLTTVICIDAPIIPDWVVGAPSSWLLCCFVMAPHSLNIWLLFVTT